MNKVELLPPDFRAGGSPVRTHELRSPPKAVRLLLCAWGYSYVRQFLEYSLPTMLAPGNIPALAAALPTEFVILTSVDDESFISEHPAFKRLASICTTRIHTIDHLISDGNYSTTITLAYTEAVRELGEAMIDTCFMFLVSDYILADGSFANVLKRVQQGTSAVVAGNMQVTRESALPWLQERLVGNELSLSLQPRELMQWALTNLHPLVLANMVNLPFSHNTDSNRLFWRIDGNTILGRFYLLHMLCVRPEVTDFIIGSSCDYSFIPEMCPSGNVDIITDSDEYLVIEMQTRDHESKFLRPGPFEVPELVKSLSEWTTSVHRDNANHSLFFHAEELPNEIDRSINEADAFVSDIAKNLSRKPQPHRGHPYWRGAMAAFYEVGGRKLNEEEWYYALGLPEIPNGLTNWLMWHSKFALMGRPPHVMPWHPAWPDFRTVFREIDSFFTDPETRLLLVSNEPTAFSVALADSGERTRRLRCRPFLRNPPERYSQLHGKFDLCLLELSETDMEDGGELTDRIVPLLKKGGRIVLFVQNNRVIDDAGVFGHSVSFQSSRFIRSAAVPTEIHYVPSNVARRRGRVGMSRLRRLMNKGFWLTAPLTSVGAGFFLLCSFVGNLDAWRSTRRVAGRGHLSSFVMRLTVDAPELGKSDALRLSARARARREGLANAGGAIPRAVANETREPQYNRCLELRDTIGLTSLGLMTNQIWHDDPRRLTFLLARYKFVAKMLAGCRNAGEVGCGDAFGTRVVLQAVPDVTVYDFDQLFIQDIRTRFDEKWPLKAEVHDIVAGPLPRKHEALFSLDVIEHIAPHNEHDYLANLCESLAENGMLIIGTPSLESQAYASPPSKVGHINCKTASQLKALLEYYFEHVFIFSMNDEVVHTGFSPMAHYLFAMCTSSKWEALGVLKRSSGESREFAICEARDGSGYYVRVTHPNTEPQRVEGFATVADAARWIGTQALDWSKAERPEF
ncbi:MAG: class I SAM-dependent methyltransferase [Xanthobacteraceae bacterium]